MTFRSLLLVWVGLLSSRIAAADTPEAPSLPLEAYRLKNGLKVVLHRDPAVPRVTVCMAYHVGSKNERAGRTGFAHFFEHMMFRGSEHVANYDVPLQEAGSSSNAFTSEDMTVYHEAVPSSFLERALYLEAERLAFLTAALDQEKFDTEREVVKNERRQSYENVPYGLAEETLLANVFPKGHPYSWSVIGSMRDLNSSGLDDLKRFFHEFYHPANATLCLAGDFEPDQAKRWIETYFGPLAAGSVPGKVKPPPAAPVRRRITLVDRVQLPRVHWAWPTVADDHADAPALDLLAAILTKGEASRLYRVLVRDLQIATDVSAASDTKEIDGLFTLQSTAAEGKTIEEIEAVFAREIERIRRSPPTQAELTRALADFERSTYHQLTSPLGRAVTLAAGFAQRNDPEYYRKDFVRAFRVTVADVQRVAERYLTSDKVVLVVRPAKAEEPNTEAVQAGPASGPDADAKLADRTPKGGPDWSKLPDPSTGRPFHPPKYMRRTLSNGLDVWIAEWHTLPIVQARLLLPAGTADDPAAKSGLAALTAAVIDEGTQDMTAVELAEAFDALGATESVTAQLDHTLLGFSTLKRSLAPTLALVGKIIMTPRFDPAELARERKLQLADLLQGPDDPNWIASRAFRVLLFGPSHPYGNPAQGFTETVEKLTVEDVREFYRMRFGPKGSKLIVVGDVEPDSLVELLEKSLAGWTVDLTLRVKEPRPAERDDQVKPAPDVLYLVDKPGAVQSVLSVGRRWVGRDDLRYFATRLGNRMLGEDFLSRLNQNLREQHGYSYGAGSHFAYQRMGSVWAARTSVRADVTADALHEVLAELDGVLGDRPFTPDEIEVNRSAELRSFPEHFEEPDSIARVLQEMAQFGLAADYLNSFVGHLQSVSPEQIQSAISAVLDPAERTILVVGDRTAIEPSLHRLPFKEVRLVDPDGRPVVPKR